MFKLVQQTKQAGFTLIEIMIVIAIIGILAAVAIPSYNSYVKKGDQAACISEARSYSLQVFYAINDGDQSTQPTAPLLNSCAAITDATGWTLQTYDMIEATVPSSPGIVIQCDMIHNTPCRVMP